MTKANICIDIGEIEEAKSPILKAIELGDERHSTYRQASNVCNRLKSFDEAVVYAEKAVSANDNSEVNRLNHIEHLANMRRLNGDREGAKRTLVFPT